MGIFDRQNAMYSHGHELMGIHIPKEVQDNGLPSAEELGKFMKLRPEILEFQLRRAELEQEMRFEVIRRHLKVIDERVAQNFTLDKLKAHYTFWVITLAIIGSTLTTLLGYPFPSAIYLLTVIIGLSGTALRKWGAKVLHRPVGSDSGLGETD
jgi:uncharacterized membrane protein